MGSLLAAFNQVCVIATADTMRLSWIFLLGLCRLSSGHQIYNPKLGHSYKERATQHNHYQPLSSAYSRLQTEDTDRLASYDKHPYGETPPSYPSVSGDHIHAGRPMFIHRSPSPPEAYQQQRVATAHLHTKDVHSSSAGPQPVYVHDGHHSASLDLYKEDLSDYDRLIHNLHTEKATSLFVDFFEKDQDGGNKVRQMRKYSDKDDFNVDQSLLLPNDSLSYNVLSNTPHGRQLLLVTLLEGFDTDCWQPRCKGYLKLYLPPSLKADNQPEPGPDACLLHDVVHKGRKWTRRDVINIFNNISASKVQKNQQYSRFKQSDVKSVYSLVKLCLAQESFDSLLSLLTVIKDYCNPRVFSEAVMKIIQAEKQCHQEMQEVCATFSNTQCKTEYEEECKETTETVCTIIMEKQCTTEKVRECKVVNKPVCVEYNGEKKCNDVPAMECSDVPKEKCWDEPREKCWDEPRKSCAQVPKEKCWTEPIQKCHQVPNMVCKDVPVEKCWEEPSEECHDFSREECKLVPHEYTEMVTVEECGTVNVPVCRPVPREECKDVDEVITTVVPKEKCYNKPKQVCKDIVNEVCEQVPKEVCEQVPSKQCEDIPKEVCTTEQVQECTTEQVQECRTVQKPITYTVPEQKCQDVTTDVCVSIPKPVCDTVQDKVERKVAREECHKEPKEDCKTVAHEVTKYKDEQECSTVTVKECVKISRKSCD